MASCVSETLTAWHILHKMTWQLLQTWKPYPLVVLKECVHLLLTLLLFRPLCSNLHPNNIYQLLSFNPLNLTLSSLQVAERWKTGSFPRFFSSKDYSASNVNVKRVIHSKNVKYEAYQSQYATCQMEKSGKPRPLIQNYQASIQNNKPPILFTKLAKLHCRSIWTQQQDYYSQVSNLSNEFLFLPTHIHTKNIFILGSIMDLKNKSLSLIHVKNSQERMT